MSISYCRPAAAESVGERGRVDKDVGVTVDLSDRAIAGGDDVRPWSPPRLNFMGMARRALTWFSVGRPAR